MNKRIWSIFVFFILSARFCLGVTESDRQRAITNGLEWLSENQMPEGRWSTETNLLYYDVSATSSALLAFLETGHAAGSPVILNGNNYGDVVGRGLTFLFQQAQLYPIGLQTAGNPDSDGNGYGVKFLHGGDDANDTYVASYALAAIAATGTPDAIVQNGALRGWTYRQVAQNTVDFLAYGQNDPDTGTNRGGWGYTANFGESDNAISVWPAWAMLYAQHMGITVPQFVLDELSQWVGYIQYQDGSRSGIDGSSGYTGPLVLNNESKTGGLLLEMALLGYTDADERVQSAMGYLDRNWQNEIQPAVDYWNGNFGHPYAMWSIFEGLESLSGHDSIGPISMLHPDASIDPGDTWNWWEDYSEWLVSQQQLTGQWYGTLYWNQYLATPWDIIVLNGTPAYTEGQESSSDIIPEPSSFILLGIGVLQGVFSLRKRRPV